MAKAEQFVHGTNPVFLIDKIIRGKVYSSAYYKEKCFALNAETLIDRAAELTCIGGTYGGTRKPTPFLCLVVKLLQISPNLEIIKEYIEQPNYKYLTALGAFYLRLLGKPKEIYENLEPLYNDYRKLRSRSTSGELSLIYMDEYIEDLIRKDIYMDIALPHLTKRHILEEQELLAPRESVLADSIDWQKTSENVVPLNEDGDRIRKRGKKKVLGEGNMNPHKEPVPESVEYWNNIRAQLGLPPLKTANVPKPEVKE